MLRQEEINRLECGCGRQRRKLAVYTMNNNCDILCKSREEVHNIE